MTAVTLDLSRLRHPPRPAVDPFHVPPATHDDPSAVTPPVAAVPAPDGVERDAAELLAGVTATAASSATAAWTTPSWEEIVETHSARVFRLAYRLTGNRHDAEDLTQDVFVRVFRALSTFAPGNFEAWLHRITTNLFLDGARRRQRIRFDAFGDDARERLPDPAASPDEQYHLTNLDGEVRDALMSLRPEFRAAVVLCDIEGMPYDEVADALGIKLGTVRSRIHRGRAQLREQLAHRAPRVELTVPAPRPATRDAEPSPAPDAVEVLAGVTAGVTAGAIGGVTAGVTTGVAAGVLLDAVPGGRAVEPVTGA